MDDPCLKGTADHVSGGTFSNGENTVLCQREHRYHLSAISSFLLTIPIFIGYYALFVLVCNGIKTGLYAYFKSHRKEWNGTADREEMEEHIAQNLGYIESSTNSQ